MPNDMLQGLLEAVSVSSVSKATRPVETGQPIEDGGLFPCFQRFHENIANPEIGPEKKLSGPGPFSDGRFSRAWAENVATMETLATTADSCGSPLFPAETPLGNAGNKTGPEPSESPALPHEWAAGVARLTNLTCPAKVSSDRWRLFISDCGVFLSSRWAARASELGWTTLDLFGVSARAPVHRVQCAGLLWLLDSREIAAMTSDAAVIRCGLGSVQTYRRSGPHIGQVPAWGLPR